MNLKKKLFSVIVIVGIAVVAATLYLSLSRQRQIFDAEVERIRQTDLETETIDTELYTSGNYMAVEGYIKTYVSEYQQKLLEFNSLMNDETLADMLGIENIQSDGPDFTESLEYISQKRAAIETLYEELLYMGTEKSVKDAMGDESPGDLIIEIYEETMLGTIGLDIYKSEEELRPTVEEMLERLDRIEAVISFLAENAENWSVEDGVIRFVEDSYLEEYQSLTAQISG